MKRALEGAGNGQQRELVLYGTVKSSPRALRICAKMRFGGGAAELARCVVDEEAEAGAEEE